MKITTREVFQWNKETEKYDSIKCESYEYSGEINFCKKYDWNWWTGENSWWGKGSGALSDYLDDTPGLNPLGADKGSFSFAGFGLGWDASDPEDSSYFFTTDPNRGGTEAEILKYGIVLVGAYMLMRR